MNYLAAASVAIGMIWSAPIWAQTSPVVVELYTSQGCSSCPPADALLGKLAKRDDVIPLALHVDYWDYIGWKDEFARPAHTKRQRGYAHVAGRNMIYTPQMIINGQEDVVGAHAMELADLIARHKAVAPLVQLVAQRRGDRLEVSASPLGQVDGPLTVHLVRYTALRQSHITRGENAGRDLDYSNVVGDWTVLGQWDGRAPYELKTVVSGDQPAVVLIQRPGPGAILAAAKAE